MHVEAKSYKTIKNKYHGETVREGRGTGQTSKPGINYNGHFEMVG